MKCPKCQSENREGVKFCEECGAKMEMECPNCGAIIPLGKKFCGECGHKLESPSEQPAQPPALDYANPISYTPKHLADKILTNRSAIEGERKLITVLFLDVANFTGMSEALDPEEVHEIMDGTFKILMDEIHKYEGNINQFTGDGVMALFGAPLAHEDHAQRACYASLSIQNALKAYAKKIVERYGVDFKARIGLNSGSVVVGAIGDDLRMDYTAKGDTTNLAARMESMAEPGSVLLTASTQRLVKDYFALRSLGKVPVKGKTDPQEVYELLDVSSVVTRLDASVARGLTQYIGREREMESLLACYENVQAGLGQVVGIIAEAGVGKSRLVLELRKRLPENNTYLEGHCLPYGSSIPFLPLLDILRSFFDIQEGEPEKHSKQKMREKTLGLDEKLVGALPAFQDLLSPPAEDESWRNLEPKEKRLKTFEAIRDLLIRLSQERPLILVVDDLHWADKTSEEFLDYFIGWLANTHILLLLLYRPEHTHPWGSKSYYSQIRLDQLSEGTSSELVQSILEGGEVVPEIIELILTRAAGNPLFMEELTKTLLENGSIKKDNHKYVLNLEASDVHVPDNVQGIIAARMDRLKDNIKRTMQIASVIGRDFAFSILKTITDMEDELKAHLLDLQNLEFIYEKSLFPELEYIFKHAVTQEVAYDSILMQRRKELHARIGMAIETIYSERLEEFFEMLSHHYSRSDNLEKSYLFSRLSGDKAIRNNSAWEAFGYYKGAVGALKRAPEEAKSKRNQLEVLHLMLVPMILLGFPEESLSILQEGEELSKELGDKKSLIRFYTNTGLYYSNRGDPTQGNRYSGRAFEEAEAIQDVETMAQSGPDLCLSYGTRGEYGKAIDVALRVTDAIEKAGRESETFGGPMNVYPALLAISGNNSATLGNFEEAKALVEKGLKAANLYGNPMTLGACQLNYGWVYLTKGEAGLASEYLSSSIKCFEKAKFTQPLALAWTGSGLAHVILGDPETGRSHVEKGLMIHREAGIEWNLAAHVYSLGICHHSAGDLNSAQDAFEEAFRLSQDNQERHMEGKSRIWLGRILWMADWPNRSEAEEFIQSGIRILESLGTRPDLSIGYLFVGEHYLGGGMRAKAEEYLREAEKGFRQMGMDHWLAEVERILEKL
jgi:class 3 adenylate cyclase/tetratricopeptide (TPR) repeat protein